MSASLAVSLIQHDIAWRDPETTFSSLERPIADAAAGGVRLCVLTETFGGGFVVDGDPGAEAKDGPSATFLVDQARRHGISMMGGVVERTPDGVLHNSALVVTPSGEITRVHKRRLFGQERHMVTAGDGAVTVDIGGVRGTPFVCYDLRFADMWWERATETDLFVVIANWPRRRADHWRALTIARAIENQAYVAAVNRVGTGGGIDYGGGSLLVDPWGVVIAEAGDIPATLNGTVDGDVVTRTRASFPVLAHRDGT